MFNNLWLAENYIKDERILLIANNDEEIDIIINNYAKKKEAYGEWKVRRVKSKDFQDHFTCINILTSKM